MMTREQLAERMGINHRWLPSGGRHARKIYEWVEEGRCRIEHRGHGHAPVLVFEDGGSMEIPSVRWADTANGRCLVSVSDIHTEDKTTHYDVCGTVDTIRSALEGEPNLNGLQDLLVDIEHMIRRMKNRRDEYEGLIANLKNVIERNVRCKEVPGAFAQLAELRKALSENIDVVKSNRDSILETAESVRDVAQYLEYSLQDYRDIVLELNRLCRDIQGARKWPQPNQL